MASRITRKSARPAAAVANRIDRLPGAVFFGTLYRAERRQFSFTNQHFENVEIAERLQCIRGDFESDICEEMLWDDCQQMGFDSTDIRRFMMNPGLITSCGYYGDPIPLR
jgi:hypothetical protein